MHKSLIKDLIDTHLPTDGFVETRIKGVKFFRASTPVPCAPAVYEPSVIAIVNGSKEAVLDGQKHTYDTRSYLCCPMSMPVQAGTPAASEDEPLLGVYIRLDQRVMTEMTLEIEATEGQQSARATVPPLQGIGFADWDPAFSEALYRLLVLCDQPTDAAVLADARLREVYYAVLKGAAGPIARHAFGASNAIARSIAHMSKHLDTPLSIDDMANRAGMSRAAFHRKFKQATSMSPIQFVKSVRLGNAAMKIASGTSVAQAAHDVGYVSPSQFSREFRRLYGQSPRQWGDAHEMPGAVR